jgi:hypothetical protein
MDGGAISGVDIITMVAPGSINMGGGSVLFNGTTAIGGYGINLGAAGSLYNNVNSTNGTVDLEGIAGLTSAGVYVSATCTQDHSGLPTVPYNVNCTSGAINILHGDINVGDGQVNALDLYAKGFIYGTPGGPSDFRLKKNIQPLESALDEIEKLKPVSFDYKENGRHSLGVIAQDLEKIYPELVVNGPGGYKYVLYEGLIAPLISSVQELKSENDQLRQQIKLQDLHQEKLEKLLKEMQQKQ